MHIIVKILAFTLSGVRARGGFGAEEGCRLIWVLTGSLWLHEQTVGYEGRSGEVVRGGRQSYRVL